MRTLFKEILVLLHGRWSMFIPWDPHSLFGLDNELKSAKIKAAKNLFYFLQDYIIIQDYVFCQPD